MNEMITQELRGLNRKILITVVGGLLEGLKTFKSKHMGESCQICMVTLVTQKKSFLEIFFGVDKKYSHYIT